MAIGRGLHSHVFPQTFWCAQLSKWTLMYGDFEGSLTVSQQVYAGCRLARSLQIQVHAGLLPHERTLIVRDCLAGYSSHQPEQSQAHRKRGLHGTHQDKRANLFHVLEFLSYSGVCVEQCPPCSLPVLHSLQYCNTMWACFCVAAETWQQYLRSRTFG